MTEPHRPWEVFGTVEYSPEMIEWLNSMPMQIFEITDEQRMSIIPTEELNE